MQNNLKILAVLLLLILAIPLAACRPPVTNAPEPQPAESQSAHGSYPVSIANYDANGNQAAYSYKKAPTKVVSTHPGATELLLELGLEEAIQTTVAPYGAPLDRLAEKYAKLNIMKSQYAPSQEELLEMQPDLIVGWSHHFSSSEFGDVSTWHKRNIGTYIMPSTLSKVKPTLDTAVYASIADIGKIFGIEQKTSQYIEVSKKRVANVESAVKNIEKKKTVIILQDHPNGTFSVYDSNYLISNIVDIAGGKNLADTPIAFVGAEKLLAFDPDVIIYVSYNNNESSKDLKDYEAIEQLKGIKELKSMRAIREGNIINLPFFTVNNGGVRAIDAIEKVSKGLYPERF